MGALKGRIPWNKGKINKPKVFCDNCGIEVSVTNHQLHNNKHFYCSPTCRYKHWVGKNNPMFGKQVSQKVIDNITRLGKSQMGNKNPMFNKKVDRSGKNYFYDDVGHQCRSSWEVNFARILKYNKVDYKYEPISFRLSDGTSYTPDFYLTKENKYIEIKGWATESFKSKFALFKKEYPNINIEIIDTKKYNVLLKQYMHLIEYEPEGKLKQNFKFKESVITEIKVTNYSPKQVYDLSIEIDESFFINNILVHNSRPHMPPVDALEKWAKDKLGDPDLKWALAYHIKKYGTKPSWFIRDTIEQELPGMLARALQVPGAIKVEK